LALSRLGDRMGRYRIVLVSLDDGTVKRGAWDPGQTSLNARLAAANPNTIGYIGELDSGASAISIPVLNRAGIPQLSAGSTAVGLTSSAAGSSPGEPQKYYPARIRTFARVIPNDTVQAVAQVRLQQSLGCNKTFVLDDGEFDGSAAAAAFQLTAAAHHLQVAGVEAFDPQAADYTSLARGIAQTGADCVLISAASESHAVLVTEQVAGALPSALLFGWAELADRAYLDPAYGGVPLSLDGRMTLTTADLSPGDYPPAGRAFLAAYQRRFGQPQPGAIYGYEAMSLMLHAIAAATDGGRTEAVRARVVAAIFATRARHSVLGTYSILHNGDTTLHSYGAYRVVDGRLAFWKTIAG
jgi:branched-chain amino acid transport system substrate-binding protein